jgi:hypothetical protein
MADSTNKKTFTMVGGICAFVAAAFAAAYSIYYLVWGIQAIGNNAPLSVVFDLIIAVIWLLFVGLGVLFGLRFLTASKGNESSNPLFNSFFFFASIIVALFIISWSTYWFIDLAQNSADASYWIGYLIGNSIFLAGAIVTLLLSRGMKGLTSSILFFVGIGCFMIATSYEISGGWWVSALFAVALYGVEAMGVLARIFEDKLGK